MFLLNHFGFKKEAMEEQKLGLSQSAVLVSLSISQMGLMGKDDSVTEFTNKEYKRDPNQAVPLSKDQRKGYYRKKKLQSPMIAKVSNIANQARQYHRSVTSPWDSKWRIINAPMLLKYLHEIQRFESLFWPAIDVVVFYWADIIAENRKILGDMFRYEDYPAKAEDVKGEYSWKVEQSPVPVSDHLILKIEDKVLSKMKDQMNAKNDERIQKIMLDLFYRLYEPISDLSERLTTDNKRLTPALMKKLAEVAKALPLMNVGGDQRISELSTAVYNKLCGFTAKQIREDAALKTQLATDAQELTNRIETLVGGVDAFKMLEADE